jgi:hypothetical protein
MVVHKCLRCDFESDSRYCLARHYKRKIPCVVTKDDISYEECLRILNQRRKCICPVCDKEFDDHSIFNFHLESCASKLRKKYEEFEKKLKKQVHVHDFKDTDYSFVADELNKLNEDGLLPHYLSFKHLIKTIHCNPKYPQNHNLRVKCGPKNMVYLIENGYLIGYDKDKSLRMIYEQTINFLKNCECLQNYECVSKFVSKYENSSTNNTSRYFFMSCEFIHETLYGHDEIIYKTHKLLKK